jgi:hypothetical protein
MLFLKLAFFLDLSVPFSSVVLYLPSQEYVSPPNFFPLHSSRLPIGHFVRLHKPRQPFYLDIRNTLARPQLLSQRLEDRYLCGQVCSINFDLSFVEEEMKGDRCKDCGVDYVRNIMVGGHNGIDSGSKLQV